MEKISSLNKMLYEESDLSRVKEISEVLTSLLSLIEKLLLFGCRDILGLRNYYYTAFTFGTPNLTGLKLEEG
jgi:hypothetical protein